MNDTAKLTILYDRLAEEQRKLVEQAASQGALPTTGGMRHIADLESALAAVETMIADSTPPAAGKG